MANPLKLIVTGTGRCGTVFMAKLLSSMGMPCGHESYFNLKLQLPFEFQNIKPILSEVSKKDAIRGVHLSPWVAPHTIVADSSLFAAPFLSEPGVLEVPVVHLVRNPLKVISSIVTAEWFKRPPPYDFIWGFLAKHCPEILEEETHLTRVCSYWYHWNKKILEQKDNRKYLLHRVEEGASDTLVEYVGLPRPTGLIFGDTKANRWKHRSRDLTVEELPPAYQERIVELANELGYPNLLNQHKYFL